MKEFILPGNLFKVDPKSLGLKGGDVIILDPKIKYKNMQLTNFDVNNPITIRNDGVLDFTTFGYGIRAVNSKGFTITGGEFVGGNITFSIDYLSSDFEIHHCKIRGSGFNAIMAKTSPDANNPATWRENFTMRNVSIHDNEISDTGGEGMYIGESTNGLKNGHLPHLIEGLKIYNNKITNTGWDGFQVGNATKDCEIYENVVTNYGTKNIQAQNNGIQIGEATFARCYNNIIKNGTGNGIIALGDGEVIEYNVIENAGGYGIFVDYRISKADKHINGNVFINSKLKDIEMRCLGTVNDNSYTGTINTGKAIPMNNFYIRDIGRFKRLIMG